MLKGIDTNTILYLIVKQWIS